MIFSGFLHFLQCILTGLLSEAVSRIERALFSSARVIPVLPCLADSLDKGSQHRAENGGRGCTAAIGEPFPSSEADWIGSDNSGVLRRRQGQGSPEAWHFTRGMKTASTQGPFHKVAVTLEEFVTKKTEPRQPGFFPLRL